MGYLDEVPLPIPEQRDPLRYLLNEQQQLYVSQLLTAGAPSQDVPSDSAFLPQLVSSFTSRAADFNLDGYINGSEMMYFVKTSVPTITRSAQDPQSGYYPRADFGDFVMGPAQAAAPDEEPRLPIPPRFDSIWTTFYYDKEQGRWFEFDKADGHLKKIFKHKGIAKDGVVKNAVVLLSESSPELEVRLPLEGGYFWTRGWTRDVPVVPLYEAPDEAIVKQMREHTP
jgi:hypothetical protein